MRRSRLLSRLLACPQPWAVVLDAGEAGGTVAEIRSRFPFYLPTWRLITLPSAPHGIRQRLAALAAGLGRVPVLYAGQHAPDVASHWIRRNPRYWLNHQDNCRVAWEWHELVWQHTVPKPDVALARQRFNDFVHQHDLTRFGRAYVFGTGPSLARARDRQWDDGVRIVCNTIVRDRELWHHLRPHVIVAADAGYHFSFTSHAHAFRQDLRARLLETETLFLYPEIFDAVVRREVRGLEDRLIPVAQGTMGEINLDLAHDFAFPQLHNVLPRLLSVACALSDDVHLWGFDGRAPQAAGFWANAAQQSYPEHMAELREAYPAFFASMVPAHDATRYMRVAFGDELDGCLTKAEAAGKRIVMLHPTWTLTLRKRCSPELRVPPADAYGEARQPA